MSSGLPDFLARSLDHQRQLGAAGADRLLAAGRQWDLAPVLQAGGSIVFPHATLSVCGHQIAAAVSACLNSGASRVVALGVLHALTDEMVEARKRLAAGGDDLSAEPLRGVQGPSVAGRDEWRKEFSLSHFQFLWQREVERRGVAGPELISFYPFLAAGCPDQLPGIDEVRAACRDSIVVVTMDPFHHGIGYGDSAEEAKYPESGGLDLARRGISTGFDVLKSGDYRAFEKHCVRTKSDGRDVGQVLRLLLGPLDHEILDLVADDMAPSYQKPDPTWVAGALVALKRAS
jgi:hypothetical protein